jgi:hypothetical protein
VVIAAPKKNDCPDHARDVPLHRRQPGAPRVVEQVPGLEHLRLDHGFTRILRMDRRDRGSEIPQRFPSLVGSLAGPLNGPFDLDHDADVLGQRVANRLPLRIRQACGVEIHPAGVVRFVLDDVGCAAERFPSGDGDECEQDRVQHTDDCKSEPGQIVVSPAHFDMDQSMEDQQSTACGGDKKRYQDRPPQPGRIVVYPVDDHRAH